MPLEKQPIKYKPNIVLFGAPIQEGSLPLGVTAKFEVSGQVLKSEASTRVSDGYTGMYVSPSPSFLKRYEYYLTIGKVQNAVEKLIVDIVTRDWYYESENEGLVKVMEEWEDKFDASSIFESIVRDWLICGNHILSYADWSSVQMTSIIGMKRDDYGQVQQFIQRIGVKDEKLNAKEFLFTKFIDIDRQAWGSSLYEALMNQFIDVDGRTAVSTFDNYRQMEQDMGKVFHKYGSPRVIYAFPNMSKDVIDNSITPLLESMKSGDRLTLNAEPILVTETVESQARFTDYAKQLNDEVEAGLQSSSNRLITQPSAMADAKSATEQDDERVLGLMEKIRRIMNKIIIPRVTGSEEGEVEFKWGAQDSFELEFPQGLQTAINLGLITPEEGRNILISMGWKLKGKLPLQKEQNPQDKEDVEVKNLKKEFIELEKNYQKDVELLTQKIESMDIPDKKKTKEMKEANIELDRQYKIRKLELLEKIKQDVGK